MKNNLNYLNNTNYKFRYLKDFQAILDYYQKLMKFKKFINIDFVLIDDVEMQKISKIYRNKDKTTDILSFPSNWKSLEFVEPIPLGEIFISYNKVKDQAKEYKHSIRREFCYLFTHGILHLYGLDHQTEKEEKIMNNLADKIMKKMNIGR
ncbi:rRNA maturation RNase YbeY [Mycoplasma iguanae]|uniref:Endoribonuclease YbeY n=1 Tax=Mycoplasma iguanae TaxID=292461 RepID=A0ABY5R9R8_9MOLU|nr:rRNA maturation RNase YbeY [Mycoplasma iguanae]UVD81932.1 rRNA maturation RNase YbeY [Mycoplasma iguanae]